MIYELYFLACIKVSACVPVSMESECTTVICNKEQVCNSMSEQVLKLFKMPIILHCSEKKGSGEGENM